MRCGSWLNNFLCVVFVNRNGFVVEDLSQEMPAFIYFILNNGIKRMLCIFNKNKSQLAFEAITEEMKTSTLFSIYNDK